MRTPTSWMDKGLLEDDPLASVFLDRKFVKPSQGRRNVKWMTEVARDIERTPEHLAAAKQWIAYAFAPDWTAHPGNTDVSTVHASLELLEVFVRFYWEWYTESDRAAQEVVNRQRKKLKFDYRLPETVWARGNSNSGAVVTAPAGAAGSRPPKKGRSRKSTPGALTGYEDTPAADSSVSVALRVADGLQGGVFDVFKSVISESTATCVRGNQSPPREDLVSSQVPASRAADVDMTATAQADREYSPLSDLTELSDDESDEPIQPSGNAPPNSASPTARPSVSSAGSRSTTVVPDDIAIAVPQPPTKARNRRGKKPRAERPAESLRQRLPRGATNAERLTHLAQAEFTYYDNLKRGLPDDLELEYPVEIGPYDAPTAGSPTLQSRKKSRKSTAPSPAPTTSSLDEPLSIQVASTEPQEPTVSTARSLPVLEGAADQPERQGSRGALSKRGKKVKAPSARRKLKGANDPERPAKRQRGTHDELNAIGVLNEAMTRQAHSDVQEGREDPRAVGSTPVTGTAPSASSSGRKRTRSQHATTVSQGKEQPTTDRKVAKLPRRRSNRKRLADMMPPSPPSGTLGVPANMEEQDRMLRDVASGALLDLHNQMTVTDTWTDDKGAQDDPPSSDEEEDVPLSMTLTSKRRTEKARDGPQSSDDEGVPLSALLAAKGRQINTTPASAPAQAGSVQPAEYRPPTVALPFAPSATLPSVALPFAQSAALPSVIVPGANVDPPVPKPALLPPPPKQPLSAQPIIWAESRQEVCESFDWFRSYQGGVYFNNDMVKGYLLSAFSSSRDLFARDGRLIISHGGGRAESVHSKNGHHQLHEAADQLEEDKSVRALLRTYQMKRPLVLIIDDRYALFPYDLATKGYTYVVLGFYHIANAWAERHPSGNGKGFVVRYKFAFEWCKKQPEPWWLQSPAGNSIEQPHFSVPTYMCPACLKASPIVYEGTLMCLQPNCRAFWTRLDGTPPPGDLKYDPSFVHSSFHCDHGTLEDIAPLPPATEAADGVITSRRFCKGWHCKNCGRLSSRYKWEHWECKSCGATVQVSGKNRSPKEFWSQTNTEKFMHHKISSDSGIIVPTMGTYRIGTGHGQYHTYILPQNRGRIYLILGSPLINRTADEIFDEYQNQARSGELRFRRWPLRMHQCRGTLLTNYFSQNTGEPYQYVGGTDNTVPFAHAPSAVVKARDLIQARMASVMQAESQQYHFNEVLSAAYMEKQKMAFHSDAERGLGSRVASLSLGSSAYMHFRVLKKHREDKSSGMNQNVLTLFLRHGDVLIMDGAAIQEYYEHTVVPLNFRIAATARYIGAQ